MTVLASREFRRTAIVVLLATAAMMLVPLFAGNFVLHVITISFYYVILAASWNLLAGYTGQFSLAHHAFAAVGAYTSGLLAHHWGVPFWFGIPAGVLLAGAMGYGLGRLVLRMRAIYLAIATWAFAETVHIYLTADYAFTRGELGLSVKPLYGTVDPLPYYFTFLALTAIVLLGLRALIDSPIGYFMRAIKDDELRAKSLGIDTTKVKVAVFSISSAIAGLAGAFYGHYVGILTPNLVTIGEMGLVVAMAILGGIENLAGAVIGAVAVYILSEELREFGQMRFVLLGAAIILTQRFAQNGLVAPVIERFAWLSPRRRTETVKETAPSA